MRHLLTVILLIIAVLAASVLWIRTCDREEPEDTFTRDLPVRVFLLCGACDKEVTYTPEEMQEIFKEGRYETDAESGEGLLPCRHCDKMAVSQVTRPREKP